MQQYLLYLSLILTFLFVLYIVVRILFRDAFFSEIIFFFYKKIFVPLFFCITNYVIIKILAMNFFYNLLSIILFIPLIFWHFTESRQQKYQNEKIVEFRNLVAPVIDSFFYEENLSSIPLYRFQMVNNKINIIIPMDYKNEYWETKKKILQQVIEKKYSKEKFYLVFDYKITPKKKNETIFLI